MKVKKQNKSMYHWVILVCCILTLMFAYSTRFGLAQLFTTQIIKETGFATSAYFLSTTIASIICVFTGQFYLVGALQGFFAMGACTIPVTVLITNWFEKNRGLMISIAMMGISLGGTFLSPFLSWTIGMFGWRRAYFILGAVSLCVLIPISAFIVRRSPEDVGLFPYGHGEESSGKHGKNKSVPANSWNATLSEARKTPIL